MLVKIAKSEVVCRFIKLLEGFGTLEEHSGSVEGCLIQN